MKPSVLIICYSNHSIEPRLLKVVRALSNSYEITTAGFSGVSNDERVSFIKLTEQVSKPLAFTFHHNKPVLIRKAVSLAEKIYQRLFRLGHGYFFSKRDFELLKEKKYDLIISHHPNSLELGAKLAKKNHAKLVFNCHEYYPLEFDNKPAWMQYDKPVIEKVLNKYKSKVNLWLTVSQHIQKEYESNYGARGFLLYNSKPYQDIIPSRAQDNDIRIIHHGAAMPERNLENMIEVFKELPGNYSFYLMLVPNNPEYLVWLKEKYSGLPRLHFVNPVPTEKIPQEISKYDVGLYFLGDTIFNNKYCLPNKIFEYIQARLCLVITPNPEMKDLVDRFDIGFVANAYSHEACLQVMSGLTAEKINGAKEKCEVAAKMLDSGKNEDELLKVINDLCAV